MKPAIIRLDEITPQPWRNGGGHTRELLRLHGGNRSTWQCRISVADIESDGPFSAFDGVERWFAVIDGAGVALRFASQETRLLKSSPPFCFDGGTPPDCQLIHGATRDLNLMIAKGSGKMNIAYDRLAWQAISTPAMPAMPLAPLPSLTLSMPPTSPTRSMPPTPSAQCGLFATAAGYIHCDALSVQPIGPIAAHSLVWFSALPMKPLVFEALHQATQCIGWWLSFSPSDAKRKEF